ncbi:vacuolar protein sorting-associated protein 37C-like [Penaeus indicus]|uniref:vacuolar protein sorting-associated protein 37C-like n=1 Tax=Penaeus indicus TaxID=29960 RepID=UPI00300D3BDC
MKEDEPVRLIQLKRSWTKLQEFTAVSECLRGLPLPLSELGDDSGIYRPAEHLHRPPSIRAGRPLFLWPRSPPASPAQPAQPPIDAPAPRRTGPRGWQARVTVLMPDKRGEVTAHAACAPEPWAALSPTYPGQPSLRRTLGSPLPDVPWAALFPDVPWAALSSTLSDVPRAALSPTYPGQPSSPTYPGQPSPRRTLGSPLPDVPWPALFPDVPWAALFPDVPWAALFPDVLWPALFPDVPWAALSPTYPGQPSSPMYPAQPSSPTYPGQPSSPTYPGQPSPRRTVDSPLPYVPWAALSHEVPSADLQNSDPLCACLLCMYRPVLRAV